MEGIAVDIFSKCSEGAARWQEPIDAVPETEGFAIAGYLKA